MNKSTYFLVIFLFAYILGDSSVPTRNTLPKIWPEQSLRGLNINLVSYEKNNPNKKLFPDALTFEQLKKWNVNVVRCIIMTDIDSLWKGRNRETFPGLTNSNFIAFYKDHLRGLDSVIKYCSKNNISIILSAGDIIGRKKAGAQFELYFKRLWEFIAKHYNNTKCIIAYDVLNEPNTSFENDVLVKNNYEIINTIRQFDKETYIMIEPFPWGFAESFKKLELIDDPKIIYSFHFYEPHSYTHQGIKSYSDYKNLSYPGQLRNFKNSKEKLYNKQVLESAMQEVANFQKKHNVIIFVGEFGVARWAPGAENYMADLVDLFEKYKWGWCYHSYYSYYNGFNPTYEPSYTAMNGMDGKKETAMLKALMKGWKVNEK